MASPTDDIPQDSYDWRRGGIIYQVYPRSFRASGDAEVGDLKGITGKLDYIASLGVDAIWLSPFFTSPMKDYGYDVADYCDVDPMFGTIEDFDAMLARAHALGIKIIIDMIMCHTSDQHGWFQESRSSRDNSKADWYVWADAKRDGSAPNNWQSVFGGPSWTFSVERGQYYFHNFLKEQPHVNLHSPGAKKAVLDATRFWLDRGVDGVRLDAAAHYFYDPKLRDNPPNKAFAGLDRSMYKATPYSMQLHVNDTSEAHSLEFVEEVRTLLDEYEGRIAIGELGGQEGLKMSALYTRGPQRLHTAYNFSLITGEAPSAARIRDALKAFEKHGRGDSWPSWAFSNHDVIRVASRWHYDKNGFNHEPRLSRCLNAALLSLRGTLFLYQGEELGLPEAAIPFEALQDPMGKNVWPLPGRDGCRTPIPWESKAKLAGFTGGERAWLPIPDAHRALAVDAQEEDENSTLNFTRRYAQWRKASLALISGDIDFLKTPHDEILAFTRKDKRQKALCVFNMSAAPAHFDPPRGFTKAEIFPAGQMTGALKEGRIFLPGYGVYSAVTAI
jgi:alpha-glucosidase